VENGWFEHRSDPLLPRPQFLSRLARTAGVALVLVIASLAVGMLGYHLTEHLSWIDSFSNAAMLLGGMGPVNAPATVCGKIFAGLYALYCGLAVILIAGILLAPLAHRLLHRFHLEGRHS
jgi:hypothetical protein